MRKFPFIIPLLLDSLCVAQPTTAPTIGQQIDAQLLAKDAQLLSLQSQLLFFQAQVISLRNASVLQIAGTDIGAKLASARDDAWVILVPGANYPKLTTLSMRAARVHLVGWGNQLQIDAAPGASSGISVEGPGFEACGLSIHGTAVAFKVRSTGGGFYLHDISADQQQEFCNIDAGADGGRIINCKIGRTIGANIFCSARGLTVDGLVSNGSVNEQCIRIDGKPFRPGDITVTHCDLTNVGTSKEVITVRECDGFIAAYCTIDGYCSTGQDDNSTTNDCTGFRMLHCTFGHLRPGGALVTCNATTTDALLDDITFPGSATDAAFSISKRGTLQFRNPHVIGTQSKPIAFANGGGNVQDISIQPTTQPSH